MSQQVDDDVTHANMFQFITWQWVFTSFGGTVGSLIAFGVNFKQKESTGVSNAVYTVL